ncbi:MAG: hemolysin [Desulfuromonadales bacterium GWD2_61_12]|nr:MAG: hemolysin [Desulfuromonadales bacterium GWC2_61_20]OGR33437.1 MAG: hemolysin [Desulfuromonadales bacterium GWD2_61_12]HAD03579.1 TlyA family rRNA (cytidine-2'-O)-methyltransferase [Desulfuromonas sp.]HBT84153.1 TlyA family rRNA (cytidine-2'-O)-methyltransferase [Desulfuromonas sp.]
MSRERLDKLLVDRGLVPSRERGRALILAGKVVVNDHCLDKPGLQVQVDAEIRLKGEDIPYVSRGGLKLAAALAAFPVTVSGRVAIDVGASTGGFTDCLLQHGATRVFAVDVGYGQLAWRLQQDPRVVNIERTNIRTFDARAFAGVIPDLAVIDASFISLGIVLPATLALLPVGAEIIALIKPQFEVGRGNVGKGGVVRDVAVQQQVVEKISQLAADLLCQVGGIVESPLLGPKGNREFLIYLRKNAATSTSLPSQSALL